MPVTINVNMLTVSHKGSTGSSIAFPDVCKTPSPAGPIPIPYPNVVMSSDTTQGSTTVKMDGNEIMLKGSNMKMSTGDEAGAAMGVVSSKIKGKAEFVNYSFDVKVDGKNVCRLSDPTTQNMGSMNAAAFFHIQKPEVIVGKQLEGCQKTEAKQEERKNNPKTAWEEAGIEPSHEAPIQRVVDERFVVLYFRASNAACVKNGWIRNKHKPKPHEVIAAKTISGGNVAAVHAFIRGRYNRQNWKGPPALPEDAKTLFGVVMSLESSRFGEPLKGYGVDSRGNSYVGKWITGDYDLLDILYVGDDCFRPDQDAEYAFGSIKRELNKAMEWDGIQHGPQSQWVSKKSHGDYEDFSMPDKLSGWLKAPAGTKVTEVPIAEGRTLPIVTPKVTAVAPGSQPIHLETEEDIKNALICQGCGE